LDIINSGSSTFDSISSSTNALLLNDLVHPCYNVIVGIDFTASNEWKGRKTFNSQSLHKTLGNKIYNPYQKVLSVLGFVLNKLLANSNASSASTNLSGGTINTMYTQTSIGNNLFASTTFTTMTTSASQTQSSSTAPNSAAYANQFQHQTSKQGLFKIYAYGFGDASSTDKQVFSLFENNSFLANNAETNSMTNTTNSSLASDNYNFVESFDDILNRYSNCDFFFYDILFYTK
jgi:hypothetical protein